MKQHTIGDSLPTENGEHSLNHAMILMGSPYNDQKEQLQKKKTLFSLPENHNQSLYDIVEKPVKNYSLNAFNVVKAKQLWVIHYRSK